MQALSTIEIESVSGGTQAVPDAGGSAVEPAAESYVVIFEVTHFSGMLHPMGNKARPEPAPALVPPHRTPI